MRRREYKGRVVPSRWLITWKTKEGKRYIEARLVLKGYAEENGGRDLYTRSPTASRLAERLVIIIACLFEYRIANLDVSTAFL